MQLKLSVLLLSAGFSFLLLTSCKKETLSGSATSYVEVEQKNSSLLFFYSSPTDAASGTDGFPIYEAALQAYDSLEVLVNIPNSNPFGGNSDQVFGMLEDTFNLLGIAPVQYSLPRFQANLDTNISLQQAMAAHNTAAVVANSNYELELTPSKIIVNTTTQFFQDVNDDYYLTAYILVDSLVADQAGHPDGANTVHRRVAVDVAMPPGYDENYLAYKVASGPIYAGYQFNLSLEADRNPAWSNPDHISVALVITTRDDNGKPVFVNANTLH